MPSIPARSAASASRRDSSHVTLGRVSASDMLVPRATFAQNTASFSRLPGSRIGLRSGATGASRVSVSSPVAQGLHIG